MKDNKALEELVNEMYENLEHYDTSTKTLIIKAKKEFDTIKQALTKEVSKDTNVEEVEEAFKHIKYILEISVSEKIAEKSIMSSFETIRNYISKVSFLEKLNKCNRYTINVPTKSDNQFLDNFKRTGTKVICNEDGSVDVEEPTLPNFTDIDIEKLWEIEDEVTVKENWKELIKVISKIKQALSVPTKSAKTLEELGYKKDFISMGEGVLVFTKEHKVISFSLIENNKVLYYCNELLNSKEHQAITQQLKELEE